MSVNDIQSLFVFIGGLGMFLYGMHIMADGMQKTAGSKMSHFLGMLTNNRFLAVGLGALITAIIQSSGATTVMVVGFVNAGILNLAQAVGVIMGANIGTTITSWIVSMNQLGDAFEMMKPAFFAPVLIGIGAFLLLFSKKQNKVTIGEILIGLGLLFIGLEFMSDSISGYTDAPIFADAFRFLGGNPILGMIIGAAVTALLQSSSASVGILQTLAMNGVVTTNAAIYITLGQNIGSCVTAMISSAGANRTAKRAAVIHMSFNVIGAIIFGVVMFFVFTVNQRLAASEISSVQISIFHTIFNITNTIVLFPFANYLVKLSGILVKERPDEDKARSEEDDIQEAMRHLDERIFESPSFAIDAAALEVVHMGQLAYENVNRALDAVFHPSEDQIKMVVKVENQIDIMEKVLTEYLIKVNNLSLNEKQKLVVNNLFYSISDIERVGDHAENISECARFMMEHGVEFSKTGTSDLHTIADVVLDSFSHAVSARQTGSLTDVRKVAQDEDEVDILEEELREKHIERLSHGQCSAETGVVFLDLVTNLERVSDHALNLAGYIKDEL